MGLGVGSSLAVFAVRGGRWLWATFCLAPTGCLSRELQAGGSLQTSLLLAVSGATRSLLILALGPCSEERAQVSP